MKIFFSSRTWALVFAALSGVCSQPAASQADPYPNKPVRIVVSFPPGGGTDFLARQLAERLQAGIGQTVLVENRPGGNTIMSAEYVARSAPDGYTVFMAIDTTMTVNPLVFNSLSYNPMLDFAPISHVASQPFFLVASPKAPFKTVAELVAYAKHNPGKVNYGTGSWGGVLALEKMKLDAAIDVVRIPFKGLMLPSLLSGDLHVGIALVVPYDGYVQQGKLLGLATTGPQREASLPGIPTMREAGYPELELGVWNGLFAPAGTSPAIIGKLNAEVRKALADPGLTARLTKAGAYPSPSTPAQLHDLMKRDRERWSKVLKDSGIRLVE